MSFTHGYVPALRYHWLTPVYDLACRAMGLGERLRRFEVGLLDDLEPRLILEVGCGTGELLRFVARRFPKALLTGLDADPQVLERARGKLAQQGIPATLVPGLAQELPFQTGTFDLVLSSLMLHHLDTESKLRALRDWRRVLAPGGTLVLVDFGRPTSLPVRAITWPLRFHILEEQGDNFRGRVPGMLKDAGFHPKVAGTHGPLVTAWRGSPA